MTYQEAEQMVEQYQYLVGTDFNRKTISRLLIAPLREIGIAKLMYNYVNNINSDSFYESYAAFEIWVVFDEEDWLERGILDKMHISKFLPMLDNQLD